jgi:putative ABC transport system substrate-binding protein
MRARLLCIALSAALLTGWPPLDSSAAGKVIAAVMSSDQPRYRDAHRSFVKSLTARGYSPATNEIILQVPNPDQLSRSNTIHKFNTYKPDLILAYGAPAALVAIKESEGIPVVSTDIYTSEPPAKGMCGVSSRIPMITLLKTLQEILPYRRIGILYNNHESGSQHQADDLKKTAIQLGVAVVEGNFTSAAALETGIHTFIERVDVLIATESSIVDHQFERIINYAKSHNKPVAAVIPGSAERGALVSLEISPQEQGHLAAEIVVRILEGANPEHLSLLMPRQVELIINAHIARELGISLPFKVLGNATRVLK